MSLISVSVLRKNIAALFEGAGLSLENSDIVTDILLDAEISGITTHGISMVPAHIEKLHNNSYSVNGQLEFERDGTGFTIFNANNMIGMLSAYKAMEKAITLSCGNGIQLVLCNHANTYSAGAYYVKMAVKKGLIGIAACNAPAQMAPLGGKEKLLGTNPFSIGVPAKNEAPFIFDMATSIVAKSKINEIIRNGRDTIPDGWATDSAGNPTTNPLEAVKGMILPMAGAKGYGLCMSIDILAGLLSGAAYLDKVGRFYPLENGCMNVGHSFITIDPKVLYGEKFYEDMDKYLNRIRSSESASGRKIIAPGDDKQAITRQNTENGLNVSDRLKDEFDSLAKELRIETLNW